MPNATHSANLSVLPYWALFRLGWLGALEHPDPHVRWRTHRKAGRVFAKVVRALGATKVASDIPTGLTAVDHPRTTAHFYLSPSVSPVQLRTALSAAIGRSVPTLP